MGIGRTSNETGQKSGCGRSAAEDHTADRRDVGRQGFAAGEIPLGDERVNRSSVLGVSADPEFIDGNDVHGHLEAAAERVAAELVREYAADTSCDQEGLYARRVGERLAAADVEPIVPAGRAERFD